MIVLDTHAWLWWTSDPQRLSAPAQEAIDRADTLGVPAICCFEVATLDARKRIELQRPAREWVRHALAHPRVEEMPITAEIAVQAGGLDRSRFPGDSSDRLIYSTASLAGATLVSADRAMSAFDPARIVW